MTVVTEDNLQRAVDILNDDAEAAATFNLTRAKNARELLHAELFLESNHKGVDAKNASVEINQQYIEVKDREAKFLFDLKKAQGQIRWAVTIRDIWRSENKNARDAETIF